MFETYPGIGTYGSRRSIPMGDGGGRTFGGDRDKVLSARRILVNFFRNDPNHQVVQRFNELTPRSSVGVYAYKDLLWHDPTVASAELKRLPTVTSQFRSRVRVRPEFLGRRCHVLLLQVRESFHRATNISMSATS